VTHAKELFTVSEQEKRLEAARPQESNGSTVVEVES